MRARTYLSRLLLLLLAQKLLLFCFALAEEGEGLPVGGLLEVPDIEDDVPLPPADISPVEAAQEIDLPDHFDWRGHRCLAPARSQGGCGSCWAFAGTTALASRFCLADPVQKLVRFSPQYHVNCDHSSYSVVTNKGCSGGHHFALHVHTENHGTVLDACQPYTGRQGGCASKCADGSSPDRYFTHAGIRYSRKSLHEIQKAIYTEGPVPAAFSAYSGIYSASKNGLDGGRGIYQRSESETFRYGHAVVLIGWGTAANGVPYWICMNSWGTRYHDNGVFYIRRGTNECSIETYTGSAMPDRARSGLTDDKEPPVAQKAVLIVDEPTAGDTVVVGQNLRIEVSVASGPPPTDARVVLVPNSGARETVVVPMVSFADGHFVRTVKIAESFPVGRYRVRVEQPKSSTALVTFPAASSGLINIVAARPPATLAPATAPIAGSVHECHADGSSDVVTVTWHADSRIEKVTLTLMRFSKVVMELGTVANSGEHQFSVPCGVRALPTSEKYRIRVADVAAKANPALSEYFTMLSPETHVDGTVTTPSASEAAKVVGGKKLSVGWKFSVSPSWDTFDLPDDVELALVCNGAVHALGTSKSSPISGADSCHEVTMPKGLGGQKCKFSVSSGEASVPTLYSEEFVVKAIEADSSISIGDVPVSLVQFSPFALCPKVSGDRASDFIDVYLYGPNGALAARLAHRETVKCLTLRVPEVPAGFYVLRVLMTEKPHIFVDSEPIRVESAPEPISLPPPHVEVPADVPMFSYFRAPSSAKAGQAISVRWSFKGEIDVVVLKFGDRVLGSTSSRYGARITIPVDAEPKKTKLAIVGQGTVAKAETMIEILPKIAIPSFSVSSPAGSVAYGRQKVLLRCQSAARGVSGRVEVFQGTKKLADVTPTPTPQICDRLTDSFYVTLPKSLPAGKELNVVVTGTAGGTSKTASSPSFTIQEVSQCDEPICLRVSAKCSEITVDWDTDGVPDRFILEVRGKAIILRKSTENSGRIVLRAPSWAPDGKYRVFAIFGGKRYPSDAFDLEKC